MFCNGKCKVEEETESGVLIKKCGLRRTLIQKDRHTEEITEHEMCVFDAIMNSLHRIEDVSVVQTQTIQEQRNENEEHAFDIARTVAQGFLGIIHTINDSNEKFKFVEALKLVEVENNEERIEKLNYTKREIE